MLSRMSVAVLAIVAPCVCVATAADAQSSCPKPRMPQFRGPQANRPAPPQGQGRWQQGGNGWTGPQQGNASGGDRQPAPTQNRPAPNRPAPNRPTQPANTQQPSNNKPAPSPVNGDVKAVSLKLHNDLRDLTSNFRLGQLAWNDTLAAGAQQRAAHYDQQGQLDHHVGWQSTGDGTMAEVLAGRGTRGDVNGLIRLFINEGPGGGHFDIMVSPNYTQVGCGEVNGMLACHYK